MESLLVNFVSKDVRFGMGLSSGRIAEPARLDRLLLLNALACPLLKPVCEQPVFREVFGLI